MADELTVNSSMAYADADQVEAAMQVRDVKITTTSPGVFYFAQNYGIVETPLVSGGISGIGMLMLRNLDPTNYVEVLSGSGGLVIGKMLPGESYGPIRRGSSLTNPYLIANTAACKVEVMLTFN